MEELFALLECAPNFDGNPKDDLFVAFLPDYVDYDPGESSASIGLYGENYMVMFRPGEC